MSIKYSNVANMFYPGDSRELKEIIHGFLNMSKDVDLIPKAIVAPHAGYQLSGPIAAQAYKQIEKLKDRIENVVVMSPTHYFPFQGVALLDTDFYQTPLGDISINQNINQKLLAFSFAGYLPEAFEKEHALEVHLPFLQETLGEFKLVPLIVSHTTPAEIKEVIEKLYDEKTLIVVSSDLSHFHNYDVCQSMDKHTSSKIENKDFENIQHEETCGYYPLKGLLNWASDHSYKVKVLDVKNSGDTAGDKSRVVGYGSYMVY